MRKGESKLFNLPKEIQGSLRAQPAAFLPNVLFRVRVPQKRV